MTWPAFVTQSSTRTRRIVAIFIGLLLLLIVLLFTGDGPGLRLFRQDVTWQQMERRGTWRVGMDPSFPPFEQLDAEGRPAGYDVALAERLAEDWGMEVEIVAIGFDSLIDALMAGKIDSIVSALPLDPRLTKDIAYSEPYFEAGLRLAVLDGTPVQSEEALDARTVAVEWGSTGDLVGRRLQRQGINLELAQFPTPQEAVDALLNEERIDALLIDNVTLRQAQAKGAPIIAVGPALESNPYAIAMPLRAGDLHKRVAESLQRLQEEGVLDELESVWFAQIAP